MHHRIHAIVSSALVVAVLSTSAFFALPAPKAEAQAGTAEVAGACGLNAALDALMSVAGDALGAISLSVPTSDRSEQLQTTKYGVQQCLMAVLNLTIKVALAKMKKRLLDRLTDDTVAWISGEGGKPRFITNFSGVLNDTADAALGDTLRAAGMGKLCSQRLSIQVQMSLRKQKKFSEGVTCTLSGAAKNVAAFSDNFKTGSWIGFGQLLEPSNNRWGLELLAKDQLEAKADKLAEAAKLQTGASKGYQPTQYCAIWTLYGVHKFDEYSQVTNIADFPAEAFGDLRAPDDPPDPRARPTSDAYPADFPQNYGNLKYECSPDNVIVSTPSDIIANANSKAVTNDWDAIANMDDLTPYISAIFDAAVNRLKKEGVKGMQRASAEIFSSNKQNGYASPATQSDPTFNELKNLYSILVREASSTRALLAQATDQNTAATAQLHALIGCQTAVISLTMPFTATSPASCSGSATKLAALTQSTTQLTSLSSNLTTITNQFVKIGPQLSTSTTSLVALGSLTSLVLSLRGGVETVRSETQKIIDLTTPDAALIAPEVSTCFAAASSTPPGTYSCPAW